MLTPMSLDFHAAAAAARSDFEGNRSLASLDRDESKPPVQPVVHSPEDRLPIRRRGGAAPYVSPHAKRPARPLVKADAPPVATAPVRYGDDAGFEAVEKRRAASFENDGGVVTEPPRVYVRDLAGPSEKFERARANRDNLGAATRLTTLVDLLAACRGQIADLERVGVRIEDRFLLACLREEAARPDAPA